MIKKLKLNFIVNTMILVSIAISMILSAICLLTYIAEETEISKVLDFNIRYADSHPEAVCGYVDEIENTKLQVKLSGKIKETFKDADFINSLTEVLQLDPRPSYHNDPNRIYGMLYGNYNVKFTVKEDILEIIEIQLV